jgi:hypothetical protein
MDNTSRNAVTNLRQVHVRVSSELKKVLKMFCAREGVTEQALVLDLIEAELAKRAPDLWHLQKSSSLKASREASSTPKTRQAR